MQEQEPRKKSAAAEREEQVLSLWNEREIFKKTLEKPAPKGNYVFYDGPPFATGLPHFGHMLPTTMKDAIPRYRTMRGYRVHRRWGWDCHGLPIENLIEKELGLSTKKDIESYGVEKFNQAAAASVLRYADEWKRIIPRLGRWVDMDNDYRTMDPSYTESVWWSFKTLYERGLIYKGFKSMHVCPRCETTLSNFEVNQGYKDITDISVYVKFALKGEPKTHLLAWTTTPWTLPGNVALAVKEDIPYVKVRHETEKGEETVILAKALYEKHADKFKGAVTVGEVQGSELVGTKYEPLFDYYANDTKLKDRENGWKVYAADFVTTEDGTGIVHIAPAFGSDDYALLEKEGLPFVQHVTMGGVFKPEVSDFAGQAVKPKGDHQKADIEVLKHLAHAGSLFAKEKVTHSYPHCWRCDTPLLNYATSSWFVRVSDLKDKLLEENAKVRWVPEDIGPGRFGKWLEGARDWAISRSRYWGAPLPVWVCGTCGEERAVGSVEELRAAPRNSYVLVRHGRAESNDKEAINCSDTPEPSRLTELGREQAAAAAEKLKGRKIDAIYCSPLMRTRETAEIIADAIGFPKDKIAFDARLIEHQVGELDGKSIYEYHHFFSSFTERFTKAPAGGETLIDTKRRTGEFLEEIDRRHEGENILIVSHDTPLWALASAAAAATNEEMLALHDGSAFLGTGETRELAYAKLPHNADFALDLHRPYIDGIELECSCGAAMRRVPDVFDTWYDSGSMPYAQNHYPFENRPEFEQVGSPLFPANFIAEGLDQTRGWFYTLLVLSVALFGRAPYKRVVVNGLILAEDGRKMSKSLKNYPDLMETVDKYGADSLRYFLVSSPAVRAEEVLFSPKGVEDVMKKIPMRLGNVCQFYEMYKGDVPMGDGTESPHALDRWMLARLGETAEAMTEAFERNELDRAARPISELVDDLSTWYIRRSRDRFKSEDAADRARALRTTRAALIGLAKLMAPFMPFTAEDVYQRMGGELESVHLESWPEAGEIDRTIIEDMAETRRIVSLALEQRAKANIKVRQPLSSIKVSRMGVSKENERELCLLIMDEVNVKAVSRDEDGGFEGELLLDTSVTPELKEEGNVRELVRFVQDLRKKAGLKPSDTVRLSVSTGPEGRAFVESHEEEISKATLVRGFEFGDAEGDRLELDGMTLSISIMS